MVAPTVNFLEGVWFDDRLVAVYCNKGYARKWSEYAEVRPGSKTGNNRPQLKMGVNMVVFALEQGGTGIQDRECLIDL
ncbi:hypothetical protein ACFL47_03715 [Candidatus Latescibacterota bacterium]